MEQLPALEADMKKIEPYAWPGGYPICWLISKDGEHLLYCYECKVKDSSPVVREFINWEDELQCDGCGSDVERAYE
jgi:hypothetical protein